MDVSALGRTSDQNFWYSAEKVAIRQSKPEKSPKEGIMKDRMGNGMPVTGGQWSGLDKIRSLD